MQIHHWLAKLGFYKSTYFQGEYYGIVIISFGDTVSVCFNLRELSDPIQTPYIIHLIIQAKDFSKCPLYEYLWGWKAPLG
jgi:hypothetical protein